MRSRFVSSSLACVIIFLLVTTVFVPARGLVAVANYTLTKFSQSYLKHCHRSIFAITLRDQWNQSNICKNADWEAFHSWGPNSKECLIIKPPRHLQRNWLNQWTEGRFRTNAMNHYAIPHDFCIFRTSGWFTRHGSLFDCNYQYPLLLKRDKRDLTMRIQTLVPNPHNHFSENSKVFVVNENDGYLLSLLIPFNSHFSHGLSVGAFLIPYMLRHLSNPASKILVPALGPLQSILKAIGIPSDKIIQVSKKSQNLYFSSRAVLILRRDPFNIFQAHWPAGALCGLRHKIIRYLVLNHYVDLSAPQNLVVYLWRSGTRSVRSQTALVERIQRSLAPGFELLVEDYSVIAPSSHESGSAWMRSAYKFFRAAAVIGPHGGSFGNILFCQRNATIIEFNLPWSPAAVDDARENTVRDLFYSVARGIGISDYWNVWPQEDEKDKGVSAVDFYSKQSMVVDAEEVVEILARAGIAQRSYTWAWPA